MLCLHCIARGLVQGVGFRYSAQYRASALDLDGWVKNLRDGSVETLACGPDAAIEEYFQWLHQGPAHAEVTSVEIIYQGDMRECDAGLAGTGFRVRY